MDALDKLFEELRLAVRAQSAFGFIDSDYYAEEGYSSDVLGALWSKCCGGVVQGKLRYEEVGRNKVELSKLLAAARPVLTQTMPDGDHLGLWVQCATDDYIREHQPNYWLLQHMLEVLQKIIRKELGS